MGRKRQIAILAMMAWLSGCTCYKVNSDYPEPLPLKDNLEMVSLHQIYTLDVDGRKWDPEDAACVRDLFGEIIRNDRRSRELGLKYPPEEIVFADKDQKSVMDIFRRLDRGQMQNMTLGGSELTPILCPSSAGYVLLVKQVGFTRTGGSLVADMAKGIAIGIATMGWFYTVPILERSEMEFCVIDKNAGKVVVYCRGMIEGNPRSEEALREHVNHILKDFQQIKIE